MPPVVRNWGEEQKAVIYERQEGGLNPLRGPLAALAAVGTMLTWACEVSKSARASIGTEVRDQRRLSSD
jgi:hypothetical protein